MVEAVAAFSLAANVVQFVDFASKVTTNFWTFYKATSSSAGDDTPDIETINSDLQNVLKELHTSLAATYSSSKNDLIQLVQECQKVATELANVLQPLIKARSANLGKRVALKSAFKAVWKEDDIHSLKQRLDHFRGQLTLRLLISLR
jgi:hypothetical protein